MSEFIQQLQKRIKGLQKTKMGFVQNTANYPKTTSEFFKPTTIARGLTYLLMLATAICLTYWLMRITQIPGPPSQAPTGINKGLTLYSNQEANAAYGLFGSKPLATENIYLRGVVATAKNKDGTLDGFAIFEIDGKQTNAISVGESLGKGLSLYSIGDEAATLLYQGQKLEFKLSKPVKEKASSKK